MNVLGISGSERDAAAAIVSGGRVVAAVTEDLFARIPGIGYAATGGYPLRAIQACLERAGLTLDAIDRIVVVADHDGNGSRRVEGSWGELDSLASALRGRQSETIDPLHADAQQLRAAADGELAIFVADGDGIAIVEQRGCALTVPRHIPGSAELACAIKRIAAALSGRAVQAPLAAIERVAASGSGDVNESIAEVLQLASGGRIVIDEDKLLDAIASLQPQGDQSSPYKLDRIRQAAAAGFCARLESVMSDLIEDGLSRTRMSRAGLAGDLFRSSRLTGALARTHGERIVVSPVPEAAGRALGAAISGNGAAVDQLATLALGPEFDEQQIKNVLDNCRLEYLYEPDWPALLGRISRTLTKGLTVAWFQGAAPFGASATGTRSILCDPSNRYARDNVNRFLRHGASPDDPLGVSMTSEAAAECLETGSRHAFAHIDSPVKTEWRDRLKASVDRRGHAPVQTIAAAQAPQFAQLLDAHRGRTGVPGLVNLPLNGHGEPTACAPREAVRSFFSSAVDALVIGRFLLMKDYWLLRSGAES